MNQQITMERKHSHYHKPVEHLDSIDIYRVCELFIKNDPSGALAHAVKKILVAGGRGAKDIRKDLQEAIDTLDRKLEMLDEDDAANSGQVTLFGMDPGCPDGDRTVIAGIGVSGAFDPLGLIRFPEGLVLKVVEPKQDRDVVQEQVCEQGSAVVKPWTPGGTTGWIEVAPESWERPKEDVAPADRIQVITKDQRDKKAVPFWTGHARTFDWSAHPHSPARIVAYRKL